MLPAEIATQTVIRLRASLSGDVHGNEVASWSSPDELEIPGCSLQPIAAPELLSDRAGVISRWQWWGPKDADVRSSDRLRFEDVDYEVAGSVQVWTDPVDDEFSHSTCVLERVDG
jgi:hypothetical protein